MTTNLISFNIVHFSKVTLFTSLIYWLPFFQSAQNVFMWIVRDVFSQCNLWKSLSGARTTTTRWRLASVRLNYLRTPWVHRAPFSKNDYVESFHIKMWLRRYIGTLNSFFLIGLHRRRSIYQTGLVDSRKNVWNTGINLTVKAKKDAKSIQLLTNVYRFIKWFELYKFSNAPYIKSSTFEFAQESLESKEISNSLGLTELFFVDVKKFKISSSRQTYREIITSLSQFVLNVSNFTIPKLTTSSFSSNAQNILQPTLYKDFVYQQARNASNASRRNKRTWRYRQLPISIKYVHYSRTRKRTGHQLQHRLKSSRTIKEMFDIPVRREFKSVNSSVKTVFYNRYDVNNSPVDKSLMKNNLTITNLFTFFSTKNVHHQLVLSLVKYFNLTYIVRRRFTLNIKSLLNSWTHSMHTVLFLSHKFQSQIIKVRFSQRLPQDRLVKYFIDTCKLPAQLKLSPFQWSNTSMSTRLAISPKYTFRFKRSLFFFLLIFQNLHRTDSNWLTTVSKYSPIYTFTLFPSSNNFKLSIFKRLNLQKYLLNTQLDSYKWTSDKLFNVQIMKSRTLHGDPITQSLTTSARDNFTAVQVSLGITYLNTYRSNISRYVRVRRLRFKPGYARLWRESRSDIKEILEMQVRYQNRLTLKLQKLHRQQRSRLFTYSTATVFFSLMSSQISVDMWSTLELLRSEVIYINGRICTNHFMHLFLHDFLQIIVNIKFYFLMRFIQNRVVFTSARINKIFYRKYRLKNPNTTLRVQRKLPWKFFHLQSGHLDVLPYLEVDYFTLSSFVILDQRAAKTWVPIRAYALELTILNMYNWKYIT